MVMNMLMNNDDGTKLSVVVCLILLILQTIGVIVVQTLTPGPLTSFSKLSTTSHCLRQWMQLAQLSLNFVVCPFTPSAEETMRCSLKFSEKAS